MRRIMLQESQIINFTGNMITYYECHFKDKINNAIVHVLLLFLRQNICCALLSSNRYELASEMTRKSCLAVVTPLC